VLKIAKDNEGNLTTELYSIDQSADPISISSITLQGSTLRLRVDEVHGSYVGQISPNGAAIVGAWTQRYTFPLNFQRAPGGTAWALDPTVRNTKFMMVQKGVTLEVLDWGGSGKPVVLLAGLGNTAHVFDRFASKLATRYHVYGITRRGFGDSSRPPATPANYSADRLGDDVLAVIEALKLNRPVLIGHSIAGEELSSIGTRHPDKVAALVYLDAGYPYANYDEQEGDLDIDLSALRALLSQLASRGANEGALIDQLLHHSLPQFKNDLQNEHKYVAVMPSSGPDDALTPIDQAILGGEQKYTAPIRVPILAIFAVPHNVSDLFNDNPKAEAAAEAVDMEQTSAQIRAFERGHPSARVLRLADANHYVFKSNQADVLSAINTFIGEDSWPKSRSTTTF
jgi:pimeloyl-ACP methyl ester carboxylesterase